MSQGSSDGFHNAPWIAVYAHYKVEVHGVVTLLQISAVHRGLVVFAQHEVLAILRNANDAMGLAPGNRMSHRIRITEQTPGHGLIENHGFGRARMFCLREFASRHNGNAHRVEVVWRDSVELESDSDGRTGIWPQSCAIGDAVIEWNDSSYARAFNPWKGAKLFKATLYQEAFCFGGRVLVRRQAHVRPHGVFRVDANVRFVGAQQIVQE